MGGGTAAHYGGADPLNGALVCLDGVTQRFGQKTVLRDVSLRIGPRDFLILRGPNGGGKTTLLRLIAGLLRPADGSVRRRAGLNIGYLPQYRRIDRQFPITVEQTVRTGLTGHGPLWRRPGPEARARLAEAMARFRLEPLAGRPIAALSGGQWQRTLLARAVVSRPDLLLLDEPDTHLDAASKAELYALIGEAARSCAVVVVSHDAALPATVGRGTLFTVDGGLVTGPATAPADHFS